MDGPKIGAVVACAPQAIEAFHPTRRLFMTDDTTSLTRRQVLKAGGVTFAGYAMAPDRALADAITTDTQGLVAGEAEVPIGGYKLPVYEARPATGDRKSTRLNSSHLVISYAVFCLKKKKKIILLTRCEISTR